MCAGRTRPERRQPNTSRCRSSGSRPQRPSSRRNRVRGPSLPGRRRPFWQLHPGLATFHALAVRLRGGGADVASYQSELNKVAAGRPLQVFALADQSVNTQRSIHLQAVSLWILAALLAGVGALVVAQLLSRQGQLEASEYSSLRAVGVTSMQLWWLGLLRAFVIAIAGRGSQVRIAVGVSPLLPVGLAGVAEPDPGLMIDGRVLALGGVATVVAVVLLAAWPAYQVARRGGSRWYRDGRRSPVDRDGQARRRWCSADGDHRSSARPRTWARVDRRARAQLDSHLRACGARRGRRSGVH